MQSALSRKNRFIYDANYHQNPAILQFLTSKPPPFIAGRPRYHMENGADRGSEKEAGGDHARKPVGRGLGRAWNRAFPSITVHFQGRREKEMEGSAARLITVLPIAAMTALIDAAGTLLTALRDKWASLRFHMNVKPVAL